MSTTTNNETGTCAICGRSIKLSKKGEISRHGGTRTGGGGTGLYCPGSYELPAEEKPVGFLEKFLRHRKDELGRLLDRPRHSKRERRSLEETIRRTEERLTEWRS